MQIDRILFPITTLGPGNRLGIWTIGCPHSCPHCSNPELWANDDAKDIPLSQLEVFLKEKVGLVDGVTITGGEPFYQSNELYSLVCMLKKHNYTDILVYSGYKYEELANKFPHILQYVDVLVDGKYLDVLNNNIGHKGSSNQRCIVLNEKLQIKYSDFNEKVRERQNFISNGKIISVGIPLNDEGRNL